MLEISEDIKKLLDRKCENCGNTYGRHRTKTAACPIKEDNRYIDYRNDLFFKEQKEDEEE